ncbi:LamG-like jellyroll fold domain-containing protein [Rubritalea tangerina]|uniref:LamG-like jellyroll fold domain-containing protein n=1 Tax=Rubritalea tangerina TaxID=430798 RepID=A0ABW4Z5R0_9BACT
MKHLSFLILILSHLLHAQTPFDFNSWKTSPNGQKIDLKTWNSHNASPWSGYLGEDNLECAQRWHVAVGPLGIDTWFHSRLENQTWTGFQAFQPPHLTDEFGLLFNTIQVRNVQPLGPSENFLQPNDFLLTIDGKFFEAGPLQFSNGEYTRTDRMQFQPHVGNLLDLAEARGTTRIGFLRLPENLPTAPHTNVRQLSSVGNHTISGKNVETLISYDVTGIGCFRLKKTSGSSLKSSSTPLVLTNTDNGDIIRLVSPSGLFERFLEVPQSGNWLLSGGVTASGAASFNVEFLTKSTIPPSLQQYYQEVDITLDNIGSFGSAYDPNSTKADNMRKMLAHRLVQQQNTDGSFPWGAGYSLPAFITSISGLALMANDDPEHAQAIRKAALYVANPTGEGRENWSYCNGLQLTFLAEYYLRTKDPEILPGLQRQYRRCRRYIQADYTAGHKERPGYGGSGWVGGGAVIAMGLAIMDQADALDPEGQNILDQMLARVRELARTGTPGYGRSKPKYFDDSKSHGKGAMATPHYIAALLRGGNKFYKEACDRRFSYPSFGSEQEGHATQTLHYFFGCLGVANADDQNFLDMMSFYRWRFTIMRDHHGCVTKNRYATEFHGGDGAVGFPMWRTATYLFLLNAHKKNLAMSGKPEYRTGIQRETNDMTMDQRSLYNHIVRSWSMADAALGTLAPQSFRDAYLELKSTPPLAGDAFKNQILQWHQSKVEPVVADIMALQSSPKAGSPGQIAEILLGFGLGADFIEKTLILIPRHTFEGFSVTNLKVSISDSEGTLPNPISTFTSKPDTLTLDLTPYTFSEGKNFLINVSYNIGSSFIQYQVPATYPILNNRYPENIINSLTLECGTLYDYTGWAYANRIVLDNGYILGTELFRHQNNNYMMRGGRYLAKVALGSTWAANLQDWSEISPSPRRAPIMHYDGPAPLPTLTDGQFYNGTTHSSGKTFTFTFDQTRLITEIFIAGDRRNRTIEAWIDGAWKVIKYDASTNMFPIYATNTDKIRIKLRQSADIHEVAFYGPEGAEYQGGSSWFSTQSDYTDPAPANIRPFAFDAHFHINENTPTGTPIGQLLAVDTDSTNTLKYQLKIGAQNNQFHLNSTTGQLSLAHPLDYSTLTEHHLTFEVTDSDGGSDTAALLVTLIPSPDANRFLTPDGDLDVASNWQRAIPSEITPGLIDINASAYLPATSNNFDVTLKNGTLKPKTNLPILWSDDTDFFITGGRVDLNTAPSLSLADTTSITMIGGEFLNTNATTTFSDSATIAIESGTLHLDSITSNNHTGPVLTVKGNNASITLGSAPTLSPNSYINFSKGTTSTLTIAGATKDTFKTMWASNTLRISHSTTGTFTSLFEVTGNTLTLTSNIPPKLTDLTFDVPENQGIDATFANLSAETGTGTWALLTSTPSTLRVHPITGALTSTTNFDYEQTPTITAKFSLTNAQGISATADLTINVTDIPNDDSNNNGLYDEWEALYFPNTLTNAAADPDNDSLTNLQEMLLGTNPADQDSDNDGFDDATEIQNNTNPLDPSSIPADLHTASTVLLHWDFNHSDNDTILDTQNAIPATLRESAALSPAGSGRSNQPGDRAIDFTLGSKAHALVTDTTLLKQAAQNNAITIAYWQKLNSTSRTLSAFWAISPSSNNGDRGLQAHTPASNNSIIFDVGGTATGQRLSTSGASINWAEWNHITLVRHPDKQQIWVNGKWLATRSTDNPIPDDFTKLFIGSANNGGNNLTGLMDDFLIADKALNSEEIRKLANGAPLTDQPIVTFPDSKLLATIPNHSPTHDITLTADVTLADGRTLNNITWTWDGGSANGSNPTVTLPMGTTLIQVTATDSAGESGSNILAVELTHGFSPAQGPLVLFWPFSDGAKSQATDFTWNLHTGSSPTPLTYHQSGIRDNALRVRGQDSYLSTPLTPSYTTPNTFTLSLWFQSLAQQNDQSALLANHPSPDAPGSFQIDAGSNTLTYNGTEIRSFASFPNHTWQHLAISCDGSNTMLYHNGQLVETLSGTADTASFDSLIVGANRSRNRFFNGLIDEVRLYQTALEAAKIKAIYSNETTTPGLHIHWKFNDHSTTSAIDSSGNEHHATPVNSPQWSASGVDGGSMLFDGNSGFTAEKSSALLGNTDFTYSLWVKIDPTQNTTAALLHQRDKGNSGIKGEIVLNHDKDGYLHFFIYNAGYQANLKSSVSIKDGHWHHIIAQREANTLTLFIDGKENASASGPIKQLNALTLAVGHDYRDSRFFFKGAMDDMRIYSRTLTPTERRLLYYLNPRSIIAGEWKTWINTHFTQDQIDLGLTHPTTDADNDNIPLLLEYALGLNPHASDSAPKAIWINDKLLLSFDQPKNRDDITYIVEFSEDLIHWTQVTTKSTPKSETLNTLNAEVPADTPSGFLRLRVEQ